MAKVRALLVVFLAVMSASAYSFMPAGGLWAVDEERNGNPGRGFQIEVENEVMIFTYYGYRSDGTGVFYLATGPIANNRFSAQLQEYAGGRVLGGVAKNAVASAVRGAVDITFSSGKTGSISFPGEAPKAISKFEFGYANTPDGLKGTYLYAFRDSLTGVMHTGYHALDTLLGSSTSSGNGIVCNASYTFVCEHQVSGALVGDIVCAVSPGTDTSDMLLFRMSGDRGSGTGYWKTSSFRYPLYVSRVATKSGARTDITDGVHSQLLGLSIMADQRLVSVIDDSSPSPASDQEPTSHQNEPQLAEFELDDLSLREQAVAQQQWIEEATLLLEQRKAETR